MHTNSFHRYILFILIILICVVTGGIWYFIYTQGNEGTLTVAYLDIGQGDAIFIETPNGTQVLIDGGKDKRVLSKLAENMSFWDHSIDMIIATHPDSDHIGGLPSVLSHFKVKILLESGVYADNGVYDTLISTANNRNTKVLRATAGERYDLGEEVYLDILFPDRDMEGADPNTASIVCKLSYKDTSFLFTGDSPQSIERYLSNMYGAFLDVDVLKLGHHGSKTSTSDEILGFTTPEYAIISAGKDNQYGHPHNEVLERLKLFQVPYVNTANVGTILIESNGDSIVLQ